VLFSILIANYNNGHFFTDCYNSIVNQTYKDWEVIIVDDCSTDQSVNVIKKIIGKDDRFKIFLNEENKGCGFTKNKCAKNANGALLGFLDPDDALSFDALELMVNQHMKMKDVAIVTSRYEFVDLGMKYLKKSNHGNGLPKGKSYLTYGKWALTHFATFKKEKYDLTIGIDPLMKRAVDQDLYYKLEEQGGHFFLNKILYKYRIHKNSISGNQNVYKARYWHYYAMNKAYKRRRLFNMKIDNFTKDDFNKYTCDYYLLRFEKSKETKKLNVKFYFLIKAILASPRYKVNRKFKSLILLIFRRI
jgi:glycosyltransferase involved in cell wall biosynthesis